MKPKQISHISSPVDYEKAIGEIDRLMRRGEQNLTSEEMESLDKIAELVEEYEDRNGMAPVPRSKELAKENDRDKIAAVLGYVPDLIGLIEFKMYQLKMNQNALAETLKMPASKISQILNKKREPDVPFLKGIHEKLGIDGNYILEAV
jgi:HTH-type transcriptional regulator / antitoxin HigA